MTDLLKQKTIKKGIILMLSLTLVAIFSKTLHLLPGKITATFFVSRLFFWGILLILILYTQKAEKGPFLLYEEKKYGFWRTIVNVLLIFLTIIIGNAIIFYSLKLSGHSPKSLMMEKVVSVVSKNTWLLVFTCITAGITEELLFRGYLLPRLEILFKSPLWAIILSSLLFGLMHSSYGTLFEVAGTFFFGLVFAFFYWKYKNIKTLIIFHAIWDWVAMLSQMHHHK